MKPGTQLASLTSPSARLILVPLILTITLVVLTVVAINQGYTRLKDQFAQLQSINTTEGILKAKDLALKDAEVQITPLLDPALIAVPAANPAIVAISAIKNLAATRSVQVSDIKATGTAAVQETVLSGSDVSFTVIGDFASVMGFLTGLGSIAPATSLEKVEIAVVSETANADVRLKVYSATLPTTLPSVLEPLAPLGSEELALAERVRRLTPPTIDVVTPTLPGQRIDPFGF